MPRGVEVLNLKKAIDQVEREKGINRQILIDAVEAAILSAARKKLGHQYDMEARFNDENDEVEVFRWVRVVNEVTNPYREIALNDAREKLDPEADLDDELGEKLDTSTFGRIAAQTAKQIIIQRVRKAEREMIFNEYKDRVGELATGVVRRFERRQQDVIVDLGRAEAVLQRNEQIPKEHYRIGDRIQAYIKRVRDEDKQPLITLSRTDEGFLVKLFEMEVPEIYEGIVRIVGAARDPGVRAKIAVASRDHEVDPVGACVGVKGARVQAVVQELRGEKIDIVPHSEDPARFVCNAIAPAQVSRVIIDEERGSMELIVPDDQQSLAIGRKGQNVRLAVKLTGWDLNIVSEQEVTQRQADTLVAMSHVMPQLTHDMLNPIFKLGYRSPQDIIKADVNDLAIIPGIGPDNAALIQEAARDVLERFERGEDVAGEARNAIAAAEAAAEAAEADVALAEAEAAAASALAEEASAPEASDQAEAVTEEAAPETSDEAAAEEPKE
ncbi:MAG: transcription termination/antitermination protein NusA [Deltaproteobacteria bacterium]|nr:MAG: transcription termination/antitermination protein NusA [Deltaproteobacteria bacterium]